MSEVMDHLGNKYASVLDLCKHYNISRPTYYCRLKKGWPLDQVLSQKPTYGSDVRDYNGKVYTSIDDMCKAYGVNRNTYTRRMEQTNNLKYALTKCHIRKKHTVKDHKGVSYTSFSAMCRAYGHTSTAVENRMNRGMTLEQALTTSYKHNTIDHKGQKWRSKRDMLKAYGIEEHIYKARIKAGWSLKDILETPHAVNPDYIRKHTERVGETNRMYNGLIASIIRYINRYDIEIQYEDGAIVKCDYPSFLKGCVSHPTLKTKKGVKGKYAGFITKHIVENYYECECEKCGLKKILTPDDMTKHFKRCSQ